ncbi:cilia- and flagella-associated protein 74 isoform X2 [Rana temporaria]|uniref:cilia- and flagella-associated protein 74 isoform X2 n=1 Tax=Rana temporaria TaxID=8407 RepID=UPI001AAD56C9|nr:cilia- and flagella-associated protein 74 isoform X2 [Rana temporaria]
MEDSIVSERPEDESEMLFLEEEENPPGYIWTQEEHVKDDEFPYGDTADNLQDDDVLDVINDSFDSDSDWSSEQHTDRYEIVKSSSYLDKVQMFRLRKKLNQLDTFQQDKELMLQKIREELRACQESIESLKQQRSNVEMEIQMEQQANNMATVFRLRALHKRLNSELINEEVVESKIANMLKDNEVDLWHIEVEQGKFEDIRERLEQDEEDLDRQNKDLADQRAHREKMSLTRAKHRKQAEQQQEMSKIKEREQRYRKVVADAQKNHEKAVQFLKETMTRVREEESEKEKKSREEMEKRMHAVLSLKKNISTNRENLRVVESRNKAQAAIAKKQEMLEKEEVLAKGGDVTKYIIHQKRLQEFERQKKEFEESQKLRKQEIISRILQEEASQAKQKKQTSSTEMSKSRESTKLRAKTIQYIQSAILTEPDEEPVVTEKKWRSLSLSSSDEEDGSPIQESFDVAREIPPVLKEESGSLSQPEFMGLWNQDYKSYKVPKEEDIKPIGGSKMEKQIMAESLRKLRSGIVEKQVVSGHEFKGCPFYSKPKVIHFKDLDVGKTYKKKVTLTNASYTINFCKLVEVSDHLKDFINIQFDPPGQMSAGMSCDMVVTFKPMIDEDLEGEVKFLAQTGPFTVPVKCTTKKCELALDKELIDFGMHVIGETATLTVTLTNQGALGTNFHVRPLTQTNNIGKTPVDVFSEQMITPFSPDLIPRDTNTSVSMNSTKQEHLETLDYNQTEPAREETTLPDEGPRSANLQNEINIEYVNGEPPVAVENTHSGDEHLYGDTQEETADIKLGEERDGKIAPFTSVRIPIIFTPTFPGKASALFEITFDNQSCKAIPIIATGVAIDVPVYVPNSNVDLKICTFDRLYQDSVVVKNRATTALRLKFEVCKKLRNHMELLPKTGFIQAQSSFSVQLKFIPRHSLFEDAGEYFDKETGVLEVPVTISVVDQTRPVIFTVHAIVTTSDLEINPTEVDFGCCTIFESVQTSIQLTNKSILPQEFGFVGIPEYVDIQPNDGFGTLLPLETITLDIIFRAPKAEEYSFDLTCKSAINRQFKVSCKAIGVHPPLELSHSLVQFPGTALNDVSIATLYVTNSHISCNEFTHPVPRIGKGEIAPVGPTSFQFMVPDDSAFTISPSVGSVFPGKRCLIQVSFKPSLHDKEIREEAIRMLHRAVETRTLLNKEAPTAVENEDQSKKVKRNVSSKKDKRKQLVSPKQVQKSLKPAETLIPEIPKIEDIKEDSDEYTAARLSIYRSFMGKFDKYIIPCCIASCDIGKRKEDESLNFSPYNTLYLELHCPAIAPPLIVTSENGRHLINFGAAAIGQKLVKTVSLQNISAESLEPCFSILNPCGSFSLLNPVGTVEPGASCHLFIAFEPEESKTFFENLEVRTRQATLSLGIKGQGLAPSLTCSVDGVLNLGYVLAKDSTIASFKLHNTSTIQAKYCIKQGSLSVTRYEELQKLPSFIHSDKSTPSFVGPQNYNGQSVFSASPVEGTIQPNKTEEITVSFSPDHESVNFSDILMVELFGKHIAHSIQLRGASRKHIMYIEGGDLLDVSTESLCSIPAIEGDEPANTLLVTLQCAQTEEELRPAVRELHVGCIRTMLSSAKKNVEFSWDNIQLLQQKGFTIEPVKALVDAGQRKPISINWIPPAGYDPNKPETTTAKLTMKGDITETYQIIFCTQVVSL